MSHSIAPTDTRPILTQHPRLSDDSDVEKNSSIASPPVKPVARTVAGASGVIVKKTTK